jgi:hypothetical protein
MLVSAIQTDAKPDRHANHLLVKWKATVLALLVVRC